MTHSHRFAATAVLTDPTGAVRWISTTLDYLNPLLAQTPLSAARKWYWRLSEAERVICQYVVVEPWLADETPGYPSYDENIRAFSPASDWLEIGDVNATCG
jgi:hypothetical protein